MTFRKNKPILMMILLAGLMMIPLAIIPASADIDYGNGIHQWTGESDFYNVFTNIFSGTTCDPDVVNYANGVSTSDGILTQIAFSNSSRCYLGAYEFDTTSIPDNSRILGVELQVATYNSSTSTTYSTVITEMEHQPSGYTDQDQFAIDVKNGTKYTVTNVIPDGTYNINLGGQAITDFQNDALTNDWVGYAFAPDDWIRPAGSDANRVRAATIAGNGSSTPTTATLTVLYMEPLQTSIAEIETEITSLQSQVTSVNGTAQDNLIQIDYLYGEWTKIKNSIVDWLTNRP